MLLYRLSKASVTASRSLSLPASRSASHLSSSLKRNAPLDIHPEVQEALATNKPIVALETALVTHGFPFPENIELARSLEDVVRSTGSVPATIGLIGGRVKVGMDKDDLETLADRRSNPAKISRRDIAPAISLNAYGGMTCSATLIFAAMAGIKVFATGGLGGVHRGGQNSMDISADLHELTRCPVGLVSSGVKSILDIRRTLEYLETLGVPVMTYGTSREFPAFFSRHSGFDVPWNVSDPLTAAKILHTQWQLGFENGALIAVPIPVEFQEAGTLIQKAVDQAVAESEENGLSQRGKEVTPWLLSRIGELTKGSSHVSNVALLKNTALIGGKVAVEYQKIVAMQDGTSSSVAEHSLALHSPSQGKAGSPLVSQESLFAGLENRASHQPPAKLMIVGSAAIDITAQTRLETADPLSTYSTAPGTVSMSLGGVARNIAEAAHRVIASQLPHLSPLSILVSPIGNDAFGQLLVNETIQLGMRTDGLVRVDKATAICNMILDKNGDLVSGVADMDITSELAGDAVIPLIRKHKPTIVALDGNLAPDCIQQITSHCIQSDIKVLFEPTSIIKSVAILPAIAASLSLPRSQAPITFSSPNIAELVQLDQASRSGQLELISHPAWWHVIDSLNLGSAFRNDLEQLSRRCVVEGDSSSGTLAFLVDRGIIQMAIRLLPFFQHLVIKCGEQGVVVVMRTPQDTFASEWEDKQNQFSQRRVSARGNSNEMLIVQHFPPLPISEVVNVTGAGDSFVGALLAILVQNPDALRNPRSLNDTIFAAQAAAILSLKSHHAVSPELSTRS